MGKSRITAGNRKSSSVDLSWGIFRRCKCTGSQEPWGSRSCCWGSTFFTLFWRKTNRSWPHCWQNKRRLGIPKFLRAPAGIFDKSELTRSCYCCHFICHREPLRSHTALSGCSFEAAHLQLHPGLPHPCFSPSAVTVGGGRSKHLLPVHFQLHWLPRMVKMSNCLGCATFKHPRTGRWILPGIWHNASSHCDEGIWNEALDLAVCFSSYSPKLLTVGHACIRFLKHS